MKHRPKHIAEYVALRGVVALLHVVPHRVALAIGWGLAWIAFHGVRYRVETAKSRIRAVLGEALPPQRQKDIAWRSLLNLILSGVEIIRVPRLSPEHIKALYPTENLVDAVDAARKQDKGAIIAAPHSGNWELSAASARYSGIPLFSFAARQKNPLVDDYLNRMRAGPGVPTILRDSGSLRKVIRRLKNREVLAILPDVRMRTPGLQIPFLGATANLGPGTAMFARQTQCPIILCLPRRHGLSQHTSEIVDVIEPDLSLDKDTDIQRMMSIIMQHIESFIRQEPEQWFWFNKRWVLDPL